MENYTKNVAKNLARKNLLGNMKYKKILPVALRELRKRYDDISYKDYLISLCSAKGSNLLMLEQMLVHNSEKHLQVIKDI